jgi:hypothetical protein
LIEIIDRAIGLTNTTWPINIGIDEEQHVSALYTVDFKDPDVGLSGGLVENEEHHITLNLTEIDTNDEDLILHLLVHELIHAEQVESMPLETFVVIASSGITQIYSGDGLKDACADDDERLPWNWNEIENEAWTQASSLTGHTKEYWFIKIFEAECKRAGYPTPPIIHEQIRNKAI